MTSDNCSDCGLGHHLHIREDGIYECPGDTSTSVHASASQDTSSEYADSVMQSESTDPLDLIRAHEEQLPHQHYVALRGLAQPEGAVVPLRRSARLENRWRTREDTGPYPQAQTRRSSTRMSEDPVPSSRPRYVSLQNCRRSHGRSYENEALFPMQNNLLRRKSLQPQALDSIMLPTPNHSSRRKSLQPHVRNRMVPVEDMEPIPGFRPFTELDPGQLPDPVTVREPIKDIPKPPFEFVWNPSVVVPEVGGMRVRVGQFERIGNPTRDTTQVASSITTHEGDTCSQSSGSESYFTAEGWSSSTSTPEPRPSGYARPRVDTSQYTVPPPPTFPGPPLPEFVQGSSKSTLPLRQQSLVHDASGTNFSSWQNEFPESQAIAQHYAAVQNQKKGVTLPQLTLSPRDAVAPMPSAPTFTGSSEMTSRNVTPLQGPFTPTTTPTAPQPPPVELLHASAKRPPRRPSMPGTLPGTTVVSSTPERAETEPAVDNVEDWATRQPWEYIHRVLTTSTSPLVMFLKTPTGDIPAAAQGALGADLHLQKMLIENEHWLLIGARDINLYEFGARFQARAATQDKYMFRFGNLNWGADVNQIEDEIYKAVMESSRRGRGLPAALPAQFMAGMLGGLVVWYGLSLM